MTDQQSDKMKRYKSLSEFYENLAASKEDISYYIHPTGIERKRKIINMLYPSERDAVCDLGCGDGDLSVSLARKVRRICGADISPTRARRARSKGINAVCADVASTPFASASFDKVICSEVIEHALRPIEIVREISRIMKSNGCAVLTVPLNEKLEKTLMEVPEKDLAEMDFNEIRMKYDITDAHLHAFTKQEFVDLLKEEGLVVKAIGFTHSYNPRFGRLMFPIIVMLRFIRRFIVDSAALDRTVSLFYQRRREERSHIIVQVGKSW